MVTHEVSQDVIRDILQTAKRIAVVGLSDKSHRTSYQIARAMQEAGYEIVPVNPNLDTWLELRAYPTVRDVPGSIDIVNVFRRSEHTPEIAREAADTEAKVLWLQQGVYHEEAKRIGEEAGLQVIMDRCIKVEQAKLGS